MQALTALERLHQQLPRTSQKEEEGWKREYLRLRRELQEQTARLARVDCVALGMSEDDGQAYREAFNRYRSTVALHQAEWPVIDIAPGNPEYRRSVDAVKAATENFVQVMHRLFGREGRGPTPF